MAGDVDWRKLIDSYEIDLPEDGEKAPSIETIPAKKKGTKLKGQIISTKIYIFTDPEGQTFTQETFQEIVYMDDITISSMKKMLDRERKKRQKDSS